MGNDPVFVTLSTSSFVYFNPRSRVGNDNKFTLFTVVFCRISIHVPAWGTTTGANDVDIMLDISIHVPAWGTTKRIEQDKQLKKFQSTFPRGERPLRNVLIQLSTPISIHVPAWGTTVQCHFKGILTFISIHVPAWGTTAKTYKFSIFIYTFLYKLVFFAI